MRHRQKRPRARAFPLPSQGAVSQFGQRAVSHGAREGRLSRRKAGPKVTGRIITTLPKAKEVRPLVERCIRIACVAQQALDDARPLGTTAERNSDAWAAWRKKR